MTRDEFFGRIRQECSNQQDYYIELLKARGFLIDVINGKYYLSDNSHSDDAGYLAEIIGDNGQAIEAEGNTFEIVLKDNPDVLPLENLFSVNAQIGGEAEGNGCGWFYFKHRIHAAKVPVNMLDPFVARYIKAFNACCVMTDGCCDGNNHGQNRVSITITSGACEEWYELICRKLIAGKFNIIWGNGYRFITFKRQDKYLVYFELNKAAEYIYNHRKELRDIKSAALAADWTPSDFRHRSDIVARVFIRKASRLLDEMLERENVPMKKS